MTCHKLILSTHAAKPLTDRGTRVDGFRSKLAGAALMLGSTMFSGCVTVNAPSEPIVIELNINITAEVVYRLAEDAGNTIEDNADIF